MDGSAAMPRRWRWLRGAARKLADIRNAPRRRAHVLEHLQTACTVLSALADGANVPGVKGVVCAAAELVRVAQVRAVLCAVLRVWGLTVFEQTVQRNRAECLELARELAERLLLLEECRHCAEEDVHGQAAVVFRQLEECVLRCAEFWLGRLTRQQRHCGPQPDDASAGGSLRAVASF